MKRETQIVTIEKWIDVKQSWFWIVDVDGNGIDGFSKKYQALDAIKRWGMIRKDKSVKIIC